MDRETTPVTVSGGAAVVFDTDDDGYAESVGGFGGHQLLVVGHGRIVAPKHHDFFVPESVISPADVESLHTAMHDDRRCCSQLPDSAEYVQVALEADPQFHALSSPVDPVCLAIDTDGVSAVVDTVTRREPAWSKAELRRILTPVAVAHGCAIGKVTYSVGGANPDDWDGPELVPGEWEEIRQRRRLEPHDVRVAVVATAPTTVGPLLTAGRDVAALLQALEGGALNVVSARNLIRSGFPHLLRGLAETEWLDVKRDAYGLKRPGPDGTRQKIELAQDVARFANGEADAILVLGFKESKAGRVSKLGAVAPISLVELDVGQYRSVIDERVVPPIDGLLIEPIDLGDGQGVLMISVPPQAKEMQPFLVHGSIVGDKVEGDFFSIVRRRGEASITTTAKQIHTYIVAGRAFLRAEDQHGDTPHVDR